MLKLLKMHNMADILLVKRNIQQVKPLEKMNRQLSDSYEPFQMLASHNLEFGPKSLPLKL